MLPALPGLPWSPNSATPARGRRQGRVEGKTVEWPWGRTEQLPSWASVRAAQGSCRLRRNTLAGPCCPQGQSRLGSAEGVVCVWSVLYFPRFTLNKVAKPKAPQCLLAWAGSYRGILVSSLLSHSQFHQRFQNVPAGPPPPARLASSGFPCWGVPRHGAFPGVVWGGAAGYSSVPCSSRATDGQAPFVYLPVHRLQALESFPERSWR